jgi:hypothetical protein
MFLADHPGCVLTVSESTVSLLKAHDWPGNVRDLKNAMEHAVNNAVGRASAVMEECDLDLQKRKSAKKIASTPPSPRPEREEIMTWREKVKRQREVLDYPEFTSLNADARFSVISAILRDANDGRLAWEHLLDADGAVAYLRECHGVRRSDKKLKEYARKHWVRYHPLRDGRGYQFFFADLDDLLDILRTREETRREQARVSQSRSPGSTGDRIA